MGLLLACYMCLCRDSVPWDFPELDPDLLLQDDQLAEPTPVGVQNTGAGQTACPSQPPASQWHPSRTVPPKVKQNIDCCLSLLSRAKQRLSNYGTEAEQAGVTEVEWQELDTILLPAGDFIPGSLHLHSAAWEELLGSKAQHDPKAAQVLSWIREGYRLQFTSPMAASQQAKPGYQKKMEVVRSGLAQVVPPDQVEQCLQGTAPQPLHFPNLKSAQLDSQFVDEEVAKLKRLGTFIPLAQLQSQYSWAADPASITINPLGVAINRKGKKRMVSPDPIPGQQFY